MVAQYIYLKISENCCCSAMHEDQSPENLPKINQLLHRAPYQGLVAVLRDHGLLE